MKMLPIAATALLLLSGCAEPFNAKVSRFQQLPASNGQSFVIQAADPKLDGGIEFGQYAQIVSAKLAGQGYHAAADPARADLVVKMAYDVDKGREKTVTTGLSPYAYGGAFGGPYGRGFGGPYGYYGRSRFAFGFYDPFLIDDDVTSFTVYTSELDLQINRTDNGKRVFEGTAKAQSRSDDLPYLVPRLVEAMFTGFPGNSGETVKITIAPEKK
ncbi:DUF4136 domain-containing protein [Sphingomonas oligophenolica]|uniref:DUF4136 domain-containing protein n=1 Tax=Sphingomonas oligophenolica TaxID=301154 RepID=A0ABU9Y9J8_9SPHN